MKTQPPFFDTNPYVLNLSASGSWNAARGQPEQVLGTRNANSQAPSQTYWELETLGVGPAHPWLQSAPSDSDAGSSLRTTALCCSPPRLKKKKKSPLVQCQKMTS